MDYNTLRDKIFISPEIKNDYYNKVFKTIFSDLLEYLQAASQLKVLPGELEYKFSKNLINKDFEGFDAIRNNINILIKNSMNPHNPLYMGHMDSMPSLFSVIGDMIAAALNNNLFSLEMSPFLTQVENQLVKEFCEIFGFEKGSGGLILGGGTIANLQALIVARNVALGDSKGDLRNHENDLVIFCSKSGHVSIQKSAMILGVGMENVVKIETNESGGTDVEDLEDKIKKTLKNGKTPMAIVATSGTTVTGSIDPLDEMAAVAKKYRIWLHIDAIWGGGLIFSKKYKSMLRGIEKGDSITFNPQKWLMVAKTCSLCMFRNVNHLNKYFRIKKDYVKEQSILTDLSELSITGTKRSQGLKLWLTLQSMGLDWVEQYVDKTMELTQYFYDKLLDRPYLKVKEIPQTAMLCMRGEPKDVPPQKYNQWNSALQDFLLKEKNVFFSMPTVDEQYWQRIILLNPYLDYSHIDLVFDYIDEFSMKFKL